MSNALNMISEETKAEIRQFITRNIGFASERECEEFVRQLFEIIAGEISNAMEEERCWFLKRIGRPCPQ
jgi:hypothetical protein